MRRAREAEALGLGNDRDLVKKGSTIFMQKDGLVNLGGYS